MLIYKLIKKSKYKYVNNNNVKSKKIYAHKF